MYACTYQKSVNTEENNKHCISFQVFIYSHFERASVK